jgi:hypothetical protein
MNETEAKHAAYCSRLVYPYGDRDLSPTAERVRRFGTSGLRNWRPTSPFAT